MARVRRFHYGLTLFVTLLILWLSLMPGDSFPNMKIPYIDLGVHVLMYMALMMSILINVTSYGYKIIALRKYWWLLLIPIGFGAMMEVLQIHLPTRSASWMDLVANVVGTVLGWFIFRGVYKSQINRRNG